MIATTKRWWYPNSNHFKCNALLAGVLQRRRIIFIVCGAQVFIAFIVLTGERVRVKLTWLPQRSMRKYETTTLMHRNTCIFEIFLIFWHGLLALCRYTCGFGEFEDRPIHPIVWRFIHNNYNFPLGNDAKKDFTVLFPLMSRISWHIFRVPPKSPITVGGEIYCSLRNYHYPNLLWARNLLDTILKLILIPSRTVVGSVKT